MKAKLVNESISDVLKGKSKDAIYQDLLKIMGGKLPRHDLYHVVYSPSNNPFSEGWDAGITPIEGVDRQTAINKQSEMNSKHGNRFFVVSDRDYWHHYILDDYDINLEDYFD